MLSINETFQSQDDKLKMNVRGWEDVKSLNCLDMYERDLEQKDRFEKELIDKVMRAAFEVHHALKGPGLLEAIYESALCYELDMMGIEVKRQVPIAVIYKSREIRDPLFLDILVENQLIIEIKATGKDYPIYRAQLLTYLRLMNKERGILINFGKKSLSEGILHIENR